MEVTHMNRSKDVSGMAAVCVLSLGAVLAGCARHDPTSDARAAFARPSVSIEAAGNVSDRTSAPRDETRTAAANLQVVVITGHRELVL